MWQRSHDDPAPGPRELALVGVAVAALAGLGHAGEAKADRLAGLGPAMAGGARHAGVAAGERVAGLAVVEDHLAPRLHAVARLAAAFRDDARRLALVGVLVAVGAAGGGEVERHGRGAAGGPRGTVALVTGHREVGAGERVGGLRVVLGSEAGGAEAVDVVTALTATAVAAPRELPRVGVGVAVGAAVVREPHRPARARGTSRSSPRRAGRPAARPSASGRSPSRRRLRASPRSCDSSRNSFRGDPCGRPRGSSRSPSPPRPGRPDRRPRRSRGRAAASCGTGRSPPRRAAR